MQNIGQAAKYIDGTLLLPGQTFSLNDTIKERTPVTWLVDALFDTVALIAKVLTAAREVDRAISAASSLAFMGPLSDAPVGSKAVRAPLWHFSSYGVTGGRAGW